MAGALIIVIFFLLMFLGIPIAFSLCLAALFYMTVFVDIPSIIIAQQILSGVDKFTLMAIPFFVVAGSLMEFGGISRRIVNLSKSVVGTLPGGMAIVTIISSMIFAAMTGAGAATTAAVGSIMIPAMKEQGYDPDFACGLQATAGIFGPLIPPSILMVLYGITAGTSVGDMLLAGLLPGIFLGILLLGVVVVMCMRRGYKGEGRFQPGNILKSFLQSLWAIFAPVLILGGIYSGIFTPTEAAGVTCFYSLVIGLFVYREIKFAEVTWIMFKSFKLAAGIMLIVGSTQAFGWVLTRERIPQAVALWFNSVISSPTVFLFAVCAMLLVAGCFIDAVPALLIMAPILVPAAISFDIDLIHFGVVMVVTLCIGLVTPPVGINLFVASSVGNRPVHKIVPKLPVFLATIIVGMVIVVLFQPLATFLVYLKK
ncbi:MAG: TRAP transporter large permease [Spirochaetales bacterium]|jgi:C4-dicarboxylate transporter DctM subunit|nr:TRAP transporter large permease [Spirochaetales bacterium]